MKNAEKSLESFHGTEFELLDTEVEVQGDLAIVYYVARYDYRDREGNDGSIPLRSVDIYRREGSGWNQCGSHITVIPAAGSWGQDPPPNRHESKEQKSSQVEPKEREELLRARERVWRAWFAHLPT